MAQSPRTCPNCGSIVSAGQRFCSNCGTQVETGGPAGQYAGPPPQRFPQAQPPPPYTPPYAPPPYAQQQYQQPQKTNPIAEVLGALGLLFFLRRYRPGYVPRRQSSGCCGCLIALVIVLVVFGIPSYFAYRQYAPQIQQQLQNSQNNTGSKPVTQPPFTTTTLNETVTYAGVQITILSAQQSSTFIDDSFASNNGMLRLNIKEANN